MADGNGNDLNLSVSWQSLFRFAMAALLLMVGYIGKGMSDHLEALSATVATMQQSFVGVKGELANGNQDASRRDADISAQRRDIDVLMRWHEQSIYDQQEKAHRHDMNQLEKKNRRKDMVVRQKTFALKHAAEHEDHVAAAMTEEVKKAAKGAAEIPK